MINIFGEDQLFVEVLVLEGCYVYWYGKVKCLGCKMGYINVIVDYSGEL